MPFIRSPKKALQLKKGCRSFPVRSICGFDAEIKRQNANYPAQNLPHTSLILNLRYLGAKRRYQIVLDIFAAQYIGGYPAQALTPRKHQRRHCDPPHWRRKQRLVWLASYRH
jgi:hypothetical protein